MSPHSYSISQPCGGAELTWMIGRRSAATTAGPSCAASRCMLSASVTRTLMYSLSARAATAGLQGGKHREERRAVGRGQSRAGEGRAEQAGVGRAEPGRVGGVRWSAQVSTTLESSGSKCSGSKVWYRAGEVQLAHAQGRAQQPTSWLPTRPARKRCRDLRLSRLWLPLVVSTQTSRSYSSSD